jgi:hypothetical protein
MTRSYMGYVSSLTTNTVNVNGYGTATGGTGVTAVTISGVDYEYTSFTSSGTLTVTKSGLFDVLMVGGGGAGSAANNGGGSGGGAGGVASGTVYLVERLQPILQEDQDRATVPCVESQSVLVVVVVVRLIRQQVSLWHLPLVVLVLAVWVLPITHQLAQQEHQVKATLVATVRQQLTVLLVVAVERRQSVATLVLAMVVLEVQATTFRRSSAVPHSSRVAEAEVAHVIHPLVGELVAQVVRR